MTSITRRFFLVLLIVAVFAGVMFYRLASAYGDSRVYEYSAAQATILLSITDSYVRTYGRLRQEFNQGDLPVPATFRAASLAHYERESPSSGLVNTSMVGLPGKEIATRGTDRKMLDQLLELEALDDKKVMTSTLVKNNKAIHRTMFPSIASNQGCVNCHNKLQNKGADDRWQSGDLMGAYVVDRFVDPELALVRQSSLVFAVLASLSFITLSLLGNYIVVQRRLSSQLQILATTDPLTGCINRREMYNRIERSSDNASGALLMIDLDKFKHVNDQYGHATGDLVLRDFSERVHACLRSNDWVARVGGEEFVVWLPDINLAEAHRIAERLREKTEAAKIECDDVQVTYTASIGLQMVENRHPSQFERWISAADSLLYRAKIEGRNRVVMSDSLPA